MDSALWADPVQLSSTTGRPTNCAPAGSPGPPCSTNTATVQIQPASLEGISAQATLTAGKWPGPPHPGRPVPVALPAAAASPLHVTLGSVLTGTPPSGGAPTSLQVTGLFRPRNPASPYWTLDLLPFSGISARVSPGQHHRMGTAQGSSVSYGPAVVNPAAFGGALTVSQGSWMVLPQAPAMARGNLEALNAGTSAAVSQLTVLLPDGLAVTSSLPQLLAGIATTIVLTRSLFTIAALLLLLVAGAGLVLAARLLASLREEESALLRARGATRWQVVRPVLAEAVVLGAAAGLAGVLAGTRLTGALARLADLRIGGYTGRGITSLAWLSALAVLVVCVAVMAWPALHTLTPDAARLRRGRQARLAGIAWAGGDLALVALAAVAVWELRGYSAVAHPATGSLGIDPVVALAPALALAGVALIPLRGLPLLARLADKATDHERRLAAAMVSWQIARRPIRQAGPVLLVVIATATTTLALAGYASWRQSAADQAAFAVGSDVQVDSAGALPLGATGAITGAPGVTAATPASLASIGNGGQLIALDASTAGKTILLRPDLSSLPLTALWQRVTPRRLSGLALPGQPDRLEILAALGAGPHSSAGRGTERTWLSHRHGLDPGCRRRHLPDTRRRAPARRRPAAPPGLHAVRSAAGQLPAAAARAHADLYPAAVRPGEPDVGPDRPPQHRFPRGGRHGQRPVRQAVLPRCRPGGVAGHGILAARADRATGPVRGAAAIGRGSASDPGLAWRRRGRPAAHVQYRTRSVGIGRAQRQPRVPQTATGQVAITAPPPSQVVPAIATSGYLAANRLGIGSTTSVPVGGSSVPVRIVASVANFPTVFGPNRALIADLGTVNDLLAANQRGLPLPVTRWWLRTADGRVPRLPAGLGLSVTSRARQQAALLGNPLLTAPRQAMLAIGVAAVLLGVLGFSVSVAASLRSRRTQSAVFAALGVGKNDQAGQLCLEQCALSLPAAAAGLLAGIGLAELLVPAITLTADSAAPASVGPGDSATRPGRGPGPPHRGRAGRRRGPVGPAPTRPGGAVAGGGRMRTLWLRLRAAWVTLTGTGAAASVAFGLLVFASVLASLAIPRESAGLRTGALQRVIAASQPGDRTVIGTTAETSMTDETGQVLATDIAAVGASLRARLAAGGMPVASDPPAWASLTTGYVPVTGAARAAGYGQPQFEMTYRTALARYSQIVAGRLPAGGSEAGQQAVVQAAVTTATAARFGLRVGTRLNAGPVHLVVTGIIRPANPAAAFWTEDPVAARPVLTPAASPQLPYWVGAVFIGPGALPLIESGLGTVEMQVTWVYPADARRAHRGPGRAGWRRASAAWSPPGHTVITPGIGEPGHGDDLLPDSLDPVAVHRRGKRRRPRARAAVCQPGRHGGGGGAARRPAGGAAPRRGVHAHASPGRGAASARLAGAAGQRGHRRGRRGGGRGTRHRPDPRRRRRGGLVAGWPHDRRDARRPGADQRGPAARGGACHRQDRAPGQPAEARGPADRGRDRAGRRGHRRARRAPEPGPELREQRPVHRARRRCSSRSRWPSSCCAATLPSPASWPGSRAGRAGWSRSSAWPGPPAPRPAPSCRRSPWCWCSPWWRSRTWSALR